MDVSAKAGRAGEGTYGRPVTGYIDADLYADCLSGDAAVRQRHADDDCDLGHHASVGPVERLGE